MNHETNPALERLYKFVFETNDNIFLTGKAGTGKTTALKYIKKNCYKNISVVAPTGVAAINSGGSTIHSFFQLPFGFYLPNNPSQLTSKFKYNDKRLKLLRHLELLVIDEISMVRADTLDAIDVALRFARRNKNPFGGVQVLLIGDMFQLPPVTRNEDWEFLKNHYSSPYFFDSHVVKSVSLISIELDKVYRQADQTFVDLLNRVRNNHLDEESIALLNSRYKSQIEKNDTERYITLTTHNNKADQINNGALASLKTKEFNFRADIKGSFLDKNYPAEDNLRLKVGARVMFLRNDKESNTFNGKLGSVTELSSSSISVRGDGDYTDTLVKKETWDNVVYDLDDKTNRMEERVIGSFSQFPLRLAWAITIHKSQGLTFDTAIIDANEAFSAGQVYVALSRCRTLEGMILKSKIESGSVTNDKKIVEFSNSRQEEDEMQLRFESSQKSYWQNVVIDLFDTTSLKYLLQSTETAFTKFFEHWTVEDIEVVKTWVDRAKFWQETSEKFVVQLQKFFQMAGHPQDNQQLQERIIKAGNYFRNEFLEVQQQMQKSGLKTESKSAGEEASKDLTEAWLWITERLQLLQGIQKGFFLSNYTKHKLNLNLPTFKLSLYGEKMKPKPKLEHEELYHQLMALRSELVSELKLPIFMVAKVLTIEEMAIYLPQNQKELLKITGFGKARVEQFGDRFLLIINAYCESRNLKSQMELLPNNLKEEKEKKPKEAKIDTKVLSFEKYIELRDISKVAEDRGLAKSTILSHLAHFVALGELSVDEFVSKENQEKIRKVLLNAPEDGAFKSVFEALEGKVEYADIRLVQSSLLAEKLV